jgi:hypothetical protein
MSTVIRALLIFVIVLLILGGAAAWYLFGPNAVASAELVPADTVAFASIPNALDIATGYQASKLKQVVDSPNTQPLKDLITTTLTPKGVDLIQAFLPSLGGQSFIAVTHLDPDHPEHIGLIAGMKPRLGTSSFDAFVEKLKVDYPDVLKQGTTGKGNVAGVDYDWIQGPGAPDKICVAKLRGWIVTSWGEATLQDWIERLEKKSTTPSLAENKEYQTALDRVGKTSMAVLYINYHAFAEIIKEQMAKTNPASGDYLAKKLNMLNSIAVGTQFENGEIVDHFSSSIPQQALTEAGLGGTACPFETLKFTGPDTRFYWASSINWKQYWKNLQEEQAQAPQAAPMMISGLGYIQGWSQAEGIDFQHNVIDALGSEMAIQSDWSPDAPYPDLGIFLKLDKPDDFKPTITAIIDTVRKNYGTVAEIREIQAPGHNFATLKFTQSTPFTPTITEDGPYFGFFLTKTQAVQCFTRLDNVGLVRNDDFNRQIGDKRNGAAQILFLDSPQLLNRSYQTALPYVSLLSMFNANLAGMLKGHDMPPDLAWLAPIGTWSFVSRVDDTGVSGYSVSGIGNQGIYLAGVIGGGLAAAQAAHLFPPISNQINTPPSNPTAPTPTSPPGDPLPQPAPDAPTNAAPAPSPETASPTPTTAPATNADTNPSPTPTPATTQ